MDTLKDKIVLITGAGRGSGRLMDQALAEHRAILAAVEPRIPLLDLTAEER